jgi:lipopolysaccharide transport system permease protein
MEVSSVRNHANPTLMIRPERGWIPINVRELWQYRELFLTYAKRDIQVRYRQTVIGMGWAVVQPVTTMIVFTLFFGVLGNLPTQDVPAPLFYFSGILPWTLFAETVSRTSNSLINEAGILQKIYFPRLVIPLSSVFSPLVDFVFASLVLASLMIYYQYYPAISLLFLPVFLILEILLALGTGLWLCAINIEYRDVRYIVPFMLQIWMFASPIVYPVTFVPARYQTAYGLINPMAGILEGFKWSLLGVAPPSYLLFASAFIIIVIFVSGVFYFRYRESIFADVI